MLTIRLQRTGRSGTAMFRMVVQDSRQTPTSGKVVCLLGSYNPHTKALSIDGEKASSYLEHGAQPSSRVVRLLKDSGVKLPNWTGVATAKQGKLKHTEKLRRNRPAEEVVAPEPAEAKPETVEETPAAETTAEAVEATEAEAPAEEA